MRKFFSIPVFVVLCIASTLFIIFSHETHQILRFFGVVATIIVIAYSSFIFIPRSHGEKVNSKAKFIVAVVYLLMLSGGFITAMASYYQMYDSDTLANLQVTFFPGAVSAVTGIIFWVGTEKIIPAVERRKEEKDMKKKMEPVEAGFLDFD